MFRQGKFSLRESRKQLDCRRVPRAQVMQVALSFECLYTFIRTLSVHTSGNQVQGTKGIVWPTRTMKTRLGRSDQTCRALQGVLSKRSGTLLTVVGFTQLVAAAVGVDGGHCNSQ